MSQHNTPVKPAGYDSRWISGDLWLGNQNLVDNQQPPDYNYEVVQTPDNRDFFNSMCPQVQIPNHPMWSYYPYKG